MKKLIGQLKKRGKPGEDMNEENQNQALETPVLDGTAHTGPSSNGPTGAFLEEDFKCPVCQDIVEDPFRLDPCTHLFCRDCIQGFLPSNGAVEPKCPICRSDIEGGHLDTDLVEVLNKEQVECEGCQAKIAINEVSNHQQSCNAFIDLDKARRARNLLKVDNKKQAVNRSTFRCPFSTDGCAATNLDNKGLIDHLQKVHSNQEKKSGVCPVCVSMPWGDPNYVSNNVIRHIMDRHKFEYVEYVNYDQSDEDAVLQAVLAKSLEDS